MHVKHIPTANRLGASISEIVYNSILASSSQANFYLAEHPIPLPHTSKGGEQKKDELHITARFYGAIRCIAHIYLDDCLLKVFGETAETIHGQLGYKSGAELLGLDVLTT